MPRSAVVRAPASVSPLTLFLIGSLLFAIVPVRSRSFAETRTTLTHGVRAWTAPSPSATTRPPVFSSLASSETVWVGHVNNPTGLPGTPGGAGPYRVGRGAALPGVDTNGMWTWDQGPDSLQGWWPVARSYSITAAGSVPDYQRPWFALDYGNQADYSIPQGPKRTFGVLGVWHRDNGSLTPHPTTPAATPAWLPLQGSFSAWMGLRAHGDMSFGDPITQMPFNQSVMEFNGENTVPANGTAKNFPGYASQMDQLLYRDIDLTGATGAALNLSFSYRTAMSTQIQTAADSRTGWFVHDPLQSTSGVSNQALGNFISSSDAGNALAPRDSFMVYVGAPVQASFTGSDGFVHPVYDSQRRWFSETIRSVQGLYREIFATAGSDSGLRSVTIPNSILAPMLAVSGNRIRVVFRVKTNRGFDDADGTFASQGRGAAQVDGVTYSAGPLSSPAGWGTFEAVNSIDNSPAIDSQSAWKSTGKPPQAYAHAHPLGSLLFEPLNVDGCNFAQGVLSMGNHDDAEAMPGFGAGGEWMQAAISPTINLRSLGLGSYNDMGIDTEIAGVSEYLLRYELYTGDVDVSCTGITATVGVQSYPALQSNGARCWGEMRTLTIPITGPRHACLTIVAPLKTSGLIRTSNASGIPDSVRVVLAMQTQFSPTGDLGPFTSGVYFDHVSLGFTNVPVHPDVGVSLVSIPSTLTPDDTAHVRVAVQNPTADSVDVVVTFQQRAPTLTAQPDVDGDGWSDYFEQDTGANPGNPSSTPETDLVVSTTTNCLDDDLDGVFDSDDPGCYPLRGEFILPPRVSPCPPPAPNVYSAHEVPVPVTPLNNDPQRFFVDSGHGRGGNYDWSPLDSLANAKGFPMTVTNTAHRREVKRHLTTDLNGNDIWVFEGHGNDCDGDETADGLVCPSGLCGWGGGAVIDQDRLVAWMAGHPPPIVILSGCKTGDLRPKLTAAGVKLVVGFCGEISAGIEHAKELAFLKKLFEGGTVLEALQMANAINDPLHPGTTMCIGGTLADPLSKKLIDIIPPKNPEPQLALRVQVLGEPDSDGDGITDDVDDCPSVPEDIDGVADDDGCPEINPDLERLALASWLPLGLFGENVEIASTPLYDVTGTVRFRLKKVPPASSLVLDVPMVVDCFRTGPVMDSIFVTAVAAGDLNAANNSLIATLTLACATTASPLPVPLQRTTVRVANPSRSPVAFSITTPRSGPARLDVFDVLGRRVATPWNRETRPGSYVIPWTGGGNLGSSHSGVYFYRWTQNGESLRGGFVLLF
jgi:hypothetical protein